MRMQEFVDHALRCLPRYGGIVGVTAGALQPATFRSVRSLRLGATTTTRIECVGVST
jgi:hypothetical protein